MPTPGRWQAQKPVLADSEIGVEIGGNAFHSAVTDIFRERLERALAGTYAFERELGGGGMSRTYLARDEALSRRVVVKVLAPELLEGLSVERFKREVLMAAQLQHPHVVPVLVSGDADGLPWFSMPYVDGESLRRRLDRGPLPLVEAMSILRDVARALAYAHGHGIVHRDIKPDNVLLSAGSATVTDFGIAKAISAARTMAGDASLTQAGMAIGTPAYMAPEQAAADPHLDHRADLYAFGAMAYEVLSGQQLFAGRTPARVLAAQLGEQPRELLELQPTLPADLAQLVMQCLAKDPDARPQEATQIAQRLDSIATTSGVTGSSAHARSRTSGITASGAPAALAPALIKWAMATVLVMGVMWGAAETVGVPEWSILGAGVLMLAGLPAILATWWVQRATRVPQARTPGGTQVPAGAMVTMAHRVQPHLSWARTWRAGVIAVSTLVAVVVVYVATRALGIGPAGSLIAKGAFKERETIVVADFRPPASDTMIGLTVAEALRTDLAQSANLAVLTRARVRDILDRMQRPRESTVLFPLAREIATREGARAVVDGEIVRLGTSYVISARLVAAIDGEELLTFRETASDDAALVPAVGALSRSIRERVGESLKGIRQTSPLERVTTSSLPALRKYVEATRLQTLTGNSAQALTLLEEAVALDSTFAMAWRRIAVILNNAGREPKRAQEALTRAMLLRERLSDEERGLTEGSYYTNGPAPDAARAIAAYEDVLRRDSLNTTALNNLSVLLLRRRQFAEASTALMRSVGSPAATGSNFTNALMVAAALRDTAAIDALARQFAVALPGHNDLWEGQYSRLLVRGQYDSALAITQPVALSPKSLRQGLVANGRMTNLTLQRGRPREAIGWLYRSRMASANGDARSVAMAATNDSAFVSILWEGNIPAAQAFLRRAVAAPIVNATEPGLREWPSVLMNAALIGDTELAQQAVVGYERDLAATAPNRKLLDALIRGYTELARNQYPAAIASLRAAHSELATPSPDQAFLMGVTFDRAGQRDSAVAWFKRALSTPADPDLEVAWLPLSKRRVAELLDAAGDARGALQYYEALLADWTRPEPALQPTVNAIKARVVELRAKLTPG